MKCLTRHNSSFKDIIIIISLYQSTAGYTISSPNERHQTRSAAYSIQFMLAALCRSLFKPGRLANCIPYRNQHVELEQHSTCQSIIHRLALSIIIKPEHISHAGPMLMKWLANSVPSLESQFVIRPSGWTLWDLVLCCRDILVHTANFIELPIIIHELPTYLLYLKFEEYRALGLVKYLPSLFSLCLFVYWTIIQHR